MWTWAPKNARTFSRSIAQFWAVSQVGAPSKMGARGKFSPCPPLDSPVYTSQSSIILEAAYQLKITFMNTLTRRSIVNVSSSISSKFNRLFNVYCLETAFYYLFKICWDFNTLLWHSVLKWLRSSTQEVTSQTAWITPEVSSYPD